MDVGLPWTQGQLRRSAIRENGVVAKPSLGAVCQISLPDGRYAYGRIFKDASIAIYRTVTLRPKSPPIGEREYRFVVGIYDDVPGSARCPIVGQDAFAVNEDPWPPPCKVVDPITGALRIYHRGEMRPATDDDGTDGLERAAVWDLDHLTERIRDSLSR